MLNTIDTTEADIPSSLAKIKPEETRRMKLWLDERIAASKKKPIAEVVTLTPTLAALLLERNPINRPIGRYNLSNLESDVISNRFLFNGEAIIVSITGILIDGQHRARVVLNTGRSIETVIVFGPAENARYTIDIGSPKTAGNFLFMKGRKDGNNLASAVGCYLQWKEKGAISTNKPTKAAILAAADQLSGMDYSVSFCHQATSRHLGSRSVLAFCHYVFWKRASKEAADEFITKLIEGDGLRKGDPILYCRNRLLDMPRGVRQNDRAEIIFKCWNAHRAGERITHHLKVSGTLPKVER